MKQELRQRLYGLVPYNISRIQQGIQYGHALQELNNIFLSGKRTPTAESAAFKRWRKIDKTFIILNGGTTNNLPGKEGSLNLHLETLKESGIFHAAFHEPDLGDQLTAVVFLADERVWDKKQYPDFVESSLGLDEYRRSQWEMQFSRFHYSPPSLKEEKDIKKILFLRDFLKQFKLA